MKVPAATQLRVEDYPGLMRASNGEIEKLFRALNTSLSALSQAAAGGLVLGENVRGFALSLVVTPGSLPVQIRNALPVRPLRVQIAQALDVTTRTPVALSLPAPAWDSDGTVINLRAIGGDFAGLDPKARVQLTLTVEG